MNNYELSKPKFKVRIDKADGRITIAGKIVISGIKAKIQYFGGLMIGRRRYYVEKNKRGVFISAMEAAAIVNDNRSGLGSSGMVTAPQALIDHMAEMPGAPVFAADLVNVCWPE